jgi:hypothetical protein
VDLAELLVTAVLAGSLEQAVHQERQVSLEHQVHQGLVEQAVGQAQAAQAGLADKAGRAAFRERAV